MMLGCKLKIVAFSYEYSAIEFTRNSWVFFCKNILITNMFSVLSSCILKEIYVDHQK